MENFLFKKIAFQKSGFFILEHKRIISLEKEVQGGSFLMLCEIKEHRKYTPVCSASWYPPKD